MNLNLNSILRISGIVLVITGLSMLPSVLISAACDGSSVMLPFLKIMAASCVAGAILVRLCPRTDGQLKIRDGLLILTICWLLSSVIGALPYLATGSVSTAADAFFESCSGFSTTGSSIVTNVQALPRGILFWRSFTGWIGGLAILLFAIALMPSLGINGQNIASSERPGSSLDRISPKMATAARSVSLLYVILTALAILLLLAGNMNLFDALIHAFGSVSTCGFSSHTGSIEYFNSIYIDIIIMIFMVICGTNFNLFLRLPRTGFKAMAENFELRFYLIIIGAFSLIVFLILIIAGTYSSLGHALSDSVFHVISTLTTTGYSTADCLTWPAVCHALLFVLIFIGGCSCSTSGGIKVIRIAVVLKLIRRGISTKLHPNVIETVKLNGRTISSDTVSLIASHTFLYIFLVFAGAFAVSFENADLTTCFSSVVMCLANIGSGFAAAGASVPFADMSGFTKILLSFYMIAGRLELYTMFILIFPGFWNPDH